MTTLRIPLGRAHAIASTLIREAKRTGLPSALAPVGSLRRYAPDIGDVTLLGVAQPGEQPALIEGFSRMPTVTAVLDRHATSVTVATARGAATLQVTTPDHAGAALVWHTGSRVHTGLLQARARVRGLAFHAGSVKDASGLSVPTPTERDLYRLLDLPLIAPEVRDGGGELDAAERGAMPELVTDLSMRGDLHMHTSWSDGRDSIEEMALAAQALGYEYIAITDHSQSAMSSRRLAADDVSRQREEIETARQRVRDIEILWGVEVDILRDGALDFDDRTLERFDIVLASLHDHGGQPPERLLARYLGAVAHPLVNVITHPANRSPAYSTGYDLDFDRLFEAAAASGTALEIDGGPGHLDMDGVLARRAVAAGATLAIDSDAHRRDALARQMRFAIGTARRGWVERAHVLNARSVEAVRDFVAAKRGGRR